MAENLAKVVSVTMSKGFLVVQIKKVSHTNDEKLDIKANRIII